MTQLERLANDLGSLSNASLVQLAGIMVRDYPTRALALEHAVAMTWQESLARLHAELGLVDAE